MTLWKISGLQLGVNNATDLEYIASRHPNGARRGPRTLKTNLGKYLLTRLLESLTELLRKPNHWLHNYVRIVKDFSNYDDNYSDKLH